MQFSKILSSFVFHVLIENAVYRISCPKEGRWSQRHHSMVFLIDFSLGDVSQKIEVSVVSTLMIEADKLPEETLPLAILRAAKKAQIDKSFKFRIDTYSYKEFLEDDYPNLPDDIFEDELISYIKERYGILSGKQFSVLEIAVAFNITIERIVNTLRLLHKKEMVSFDWARDSWVEKDSKIEWLVKEFGVGTTHSRDNDENNDNYESLAPLPDNNRLQDETWDFFICHASEDKKDVVEPLAIKLTDLGCRVWYDHWTLNIGDSLSRKIDEGLAKSKFGVVVLSPHFFQREWPQRELSGLVQKEIKGEKVILPVWHNVTPDFVRSQSPTLADKLAGSTSEGIEALAQEILMASGLAKDVKQNTYTKGSAVGPAQLIVSYE
ncbi:MAG: toll/interleukin-1 receptor domain-containing protein, partial [candidate division Zixibacteria bacterium]|nr:toll/interleukin-1 receptor domain-containing protein [candidate division Zixibacteria bacterium]